jgi:hypothetical protein
VEQKSAGGDFDAGTPEARKRACDHWFTAQQACAVPAHPPEETVGLEQRFGNSCNAAYDQLGASHTAAEVEDCAAALETWPCGSPDGPPLECGIRGSLAGGSPCISGTQCQSGGCSGTEPPPTPGGIIPSATTCGTCVAAVGLGESCDSGGCPKGSTCITRDTSAPMPDYRCVAVVEADAGQSCDDGVTVLCKPGLYCGRSKQCVLLGKLGEPCFGLGPVGCVAPLYCGGSPSTCHAPGPAGTSCSEPAIGNWGCAAGLACAASGDCEPIIWAERGQTCDGVLRLCRRGSCPTSAITGGPIVSNCPSIVADGIPCTDKSACDSFSECVNDVAHGVATTGVCQPRSTVVCR